MIPLRLKEHLLRTTAAAGLAAALSLFVASPVFAQDTEAAAKEDQDLIIVTGSRIARSEFTSDNPVSVISGETLLNSGFSNIGEALRGEIAAGAGGVPQGAVLFGGGANSIDLRNLGQDRVLVLVNGKRVANFTDALANRATDLNLIPIAMIERVEILRDGASSTYGADAVSGVVNIILKDNFSGAQLSGFQGVSTYGDGEQTQLSMILGGDFNGGKGNAVLSTEYRFQDRIWQRDRDWGIPVITNLVDPGTGFSQGSVFSPGGLFLGDDGAVFCTLPKALGGDEVTDISGTGCPSTGGRKELGRYDYALQQSLVNRQQLTSTTGYVTYEAYDWMRFRIEGEFAQRETTSYLDGNPGSFGTSGVPDGWRVPATNPFNPTGEDGLFLIRPTSTVGARTRNIEADLFRLLPTVEFDLDVMGLDKWKFEATYLWTKVNSINDSQGIWNLQRANVISDPDLCILDPICQQAFPLLDPNNPADQPFFAMDTLRPGNWTEEQIAYISQNERSSSMFELNSWFLLLTGEVIDLPAGPLGLALGYEFREEQGRNLPDSVTESGESVGNQNFATQGGFSTHEVFAEINIPLLANHQLARELTVNLQGRYFNFSDFDADTVWKAGVNYAPTQDIRFRFNIGTSFRAPTITNLFGGGTVSFDFIDDPCDQSFVNDSPNRLANCTADGIVQPFTQPSSQYPVLAGSNPDLQPETADTLSGGVVLTPRWISNLQISADYYSIDIQNIITRPLSQTLLEQCYDGPLGLADPICDTFVRNPQTGAPIGLVNQLINGGEFKTTGMDWAVQYAFDLADLGAKMDARVTINWQGSWLFQFTDKQPGLDLDFPGKGGASGDVGSIIDVRQIASARLDWKDLNFTWRMRYFDDLNDPDFTGNNDFNYSGSEVHIEHDIRIGYQWDKLSFLFGINNVFDEEPPYIFGTGNNTDIFNFGTAVVGRYFFGRVTADF